MGYGSILSSYVYTEQWKYGHPKSSESNWVYTLNTLHSVKEWQK